MKKQYFNTLFISLVTIAFVLATCFFFTSCSFFKSGKKQNVIVILIDTLRADHLSLNGYPRDTSPVLDEFAKNNLNCKWAISAAPWTPTSVASLFTGVYPSTHGMIPPNSREKAANNSVRLASQWQTLAETYKDNGYYTAAFSPNPWIKELFGFTQGFDLFALKERADAQFVTNKGKEIIKKWQEASSDKPFFLYLHYLDPHDPYTPPEPYNTRYQGSVAGRTYPDAQVEKINQYDGEIKFTDTEIGNFFDFLKAEKLYEDSIIVVLSDHGEQFLERGHQGHGFNLYNEEVHVPLFVKANNLKGEIDDVVSQIDIYPTLATLSKLENVPTFLQGTSLLDKEALHKRSGVISEIKRVFNEKSLSNNLGFKNIMQFSSDLDCKLSIPLPSAKKSLFNFKQDLYEDNPLQDDSLMSKMSDEFNKIYEDAVKVQVKKEDGVQVDEKTIQELQTLGYM